MEEGEHFATPIVNVTQTKQRKGGRLGPREGDDVGLEMSEDWIQAFAYAARNREWNKVQVGASESLPRGKKEPGRTGDQRGQTHDEWRRMTGAIKLGGTRKR